MKQYGNNKATEFSKKQIGVIYRLAKEGKLQVQKSQMKDLYDMADYYGYDDNGSVEQYERHVLIILNYVFSNDLDKAQEEINRLTESNYNLLSNKAKANWDSELI